MSFDLTELSNHALCLFATEEGQIKVWRPPNFFKTNFQKILSSSGFSLVLILTQRSNLQATIPPPHPPYPASELFHTSQSAPGTICWTCAHQFHIDWATNVNTKQHWLPNECPDNNGDKNQQTKYNKYCTYTNKSSEPYFAVMNLL